MGRGKVLLKFYRKMISEKAKEELREIIKRELGKNLPEEFSDGLLEDLGERLLKITVVVLKSKKNS